MRQAEPFVIEPDDWTAGDVVDREPNRKEARDWLRSMPQPGMTAKQGRALRTMRFGRWRRHRYLTR